MDIYEVVKKLVGKIVPIGETYEDNERYENLKIITVLVDRLLTDIDYIAGEEKRHEFSRKRAGKFAREFLNKLGIVE